MQPTRIHPQDVIRAAGHGETARPAYSGMTALVIASWVCRQRTRGTKLAGSLTWNKKLSGGPGFWKEAGIKEGPVSSTRFY